MGIEKNINTRIEHKHDIEANWNKAINFVPKAGELIIYDPDENYSYYRVKIGNGQQKLSELSFLYNEKLDKKDFLYNSLPDKPFGMGRTPVLYIDVLKLKQQIEEDNYITDNLNLYIKVSDGTFSRDIIPSCIVYEKDGIENYIYLDEYYEAPNALDIAGKFAFVYPEGENVDQNGIIFPQKGVYVSIDLLNSIKKSLYLIAPGAEIFYAPIPLGLEYLPKHSHSVLDIDKAVGIEYNRGILKAFQEHNVLWKDIACGLDYNEQPVYIAVGATSSPHDAPNGPVVAYSKDITTWNWIDMPKDDEGLELNWKAIEYVNDKFIAIGRSSTDYRVRWVEFEFSAESEAPTLITSELPLTYDFMSATIIHEQGRYVVTVGGDLLYKDDDSSEWISPEDYVYGRHLAYGNGKFVILGTHTDIFYYSEDGVNWTAGTLPQSILCNRLVFDEESQKFIGFIDGSIKGIESEDGINWTFFHLPNEKDYYEDAVFGWGCIIAISKWNNIASRKIYDDWDTILLPENKPWTSIGFDQYNGIFIIISAETGSVAYSKDGGDTWVETGAVLMDKDRDLSDEISGLLGIPKIRSNIENCFNKIETQNINIETMSQIKADKEYVDQFLQNIDYENLLAFDVNEIIIDLDLTSAILGQAILGQMVLA